MRLAVISDIHANLDAFREVLKDIDASAVDEIVCLGDNIGYGPDPEAVVQLIIERRIACVMGNHELAVARPRFMRWFNPEAMRSLQKHREWLSESSVHFIQHLDKCLILEGCRCVHGFPPSSRTIYQFQVSGKQIRRAFARIDESMCFTGHTHDVEMITYDGKYITRAPLNKGITPLNTNQRYILNIGSVGQPRDGNNEAKYVIWDRTISTVELRFVPYDIEIVANKILAAGLPEKHASRLW